MQKKLKMKNFQKVNKSKNDSVNVLKKYRTTSLKGFQEILLKSLETYTKNKANILVTLQNLNRYQQLSHVQIENLKQIFTKISNFFKDLFPKASKTATLSAEDIQAYLMREKLAEQQELRLINGTRLFHEYILSKVSQEARNDIEKTNGIGFGIGVILSTIFVGITSFSDEVALCFFDLAGDVPSLGEQDRLLIGGPIVVTERTAAAVNVFAGEGPVVIEPSVIVDVDTNPEKILNHVSIGHETCSQMREINDKNTRNLSLIDQNLAQVMTYMSHPQFGTSTHQVDYYMGHRTSTVGKLHEFITKRAMLDHEIKNLVLEPILASSLEFSDGLSD